MTEVKQQKEEKEDKEKKEDEEEKKESEEEEKENFADKIGLDKEVEDIEVVDDDDTDNEKTENEEQFIGFEINSKLLSDLLTKIKMRGPDTSGKDKTYFENTVLDIRDNNLVVSNNVDNSEIVFVSLKIKVRTINTGGLNDTKIPIDIDPTIDALDRFKNSDIRLLYTGTEILFIRNKPKLTYKIDAIDISTVEGYTNTEFPMIYKDGIPTHKSNELRLRCRITLDAKYLKELLKDSEVVNVKYFPFEVNAKKNEFFVSVSNLVGTKSFEREIVTKNIKTLDPEKKKYESSYSHGFGNVIKNIDGKVTIYMDDDNYLYLTKETGSYKTDILLTDTTVETDSRVDFEEDDIEFELD